MYHNPKNIKQEIKLYFFYLIDIGIVAGMVIAAVQLNKVLLLPGTMQLFFYILSGVFGVFLCIKTPSNPTVRNYKVLLNLLKMDRNSYHNFSHEDNNRRV